MMCMPTMPFYYAYNTFKYLEIPVIYKVLSPTYAITDYPQAVIDVAQNGMLVAPVLYPDGLNQANAVGLDSKLVKCIPLFVDTSRFYPHEDDTLRRELVLSKDTLVLMTAS